MPYLYMAQIHNNAIPIYGTLFILLSHHGKSKNFLYCCGIKRNNLKILFLYVSQYIFIFPFICTNQNIFVEVFYFLLTYSFYRLIFSILLRGSMYFGKGHSTNLSKQPKNKWYLCACCRYLWANNLWYNWCRESETESWGRNDKQTDWKKIW